MFVGSDRVELVERLHEDFRQVRDQGGVQVWTISAPLGHGKTRVLQELYTRLAEEDQGMFPYWPDQIVHRDPAEPLARRKRIYPLEVSPVGKTMPWLWWGLCGGRRQDGTYVQVLADGIAQVYAHAFWLLESEKSFRKMAGDAFDVSSATIGLLAPFLSVFAGPIVAIPVAVMSAGRVVLQERSKIHRLMKLRSERSGQRLIRADQDEHPDFASQLTTAVRALSEAVPFVIVLDDAHYADRSLVRFLSSLLEGKEARVLVVATAWPSHLDDLDRDWPFPAWLRSKSDDARISRVDLAPLRYEDLSQLVVEQAPATRADVTAALADRYDNPLALELALSLPRVQRKVVTGAIKLTPAEVEALPVSAQSLFADVWHDLPQGLQHTLGVAARCGERFLPTLIIDAARAIALDVSPDDVELAVAPFGWARQIDASLYAFSESLLLNVAEARANELFDAEDNAMIRSVIVRAALTPWDPKSVSRLARQELLRSHVAMVKAGSIPVDDAAVQSAGHLARMEAERFDPEGADADLDLARSLANTDVRRLLVEIDAAWCIGMTGRPREAVALLESALERWGANLPLTEHAVLNCRNDLAWWLSQDGDDQSAIKRWQELLPDVEVALGKLSRLSFTVRKNLIAAIARSDDARTAYGLCSKLVEDMKQALGASDPLTLVQRSYLASYTADIGQPESAIASLEELLPQLDREVGRLEVPSVYVRINLGDYNYRLGMSSRPDRLERLAEARRWCSEAIPDLEEVLGPLHPLTSSARGLAGHTAAQLGDWESARELAAQQVAVYRAVGLESSSDGVTSRNNLAYATWQLGDKPRALEMYQQLLPDASHVFGPMDARTQEIRGYITALRVEAENCR